MNKVGLGLDYSNICKEYNTVYLDRDNDDPATMKCMRSVLVWLESLLDEVIEAFNYKAYRLNHQPPVELSQIASKRFLFYSLEKEITLQSYILHNEPHHYTTLSEWETLSKESLLIKNDEEGEGLLFYFEENSKIHLWMVERLKAYSLDEIALQ